MQTANTKPARLRDVEVVQQAFHFHTEENYRHKNHPLLNAIYDCDVPEVKRLLRQGRRADICELFYALPDAPKVDGISTIIHLLAQYNALPEGVSLLDFKQTLYLYGGTHIGKECMYTPHVNVDGFKGVFSPIELWARLGNVAMVEYMIKHGAKMRPICSALSIAEGMSDFSFDPYDTVKQALRQIEYIDEICEEHKARFLMAEALFMHPNKDLFREIDGFKKADGEHGTFFAPFMCWAAKNNKLELFQQPLFRDLFSSYTYAAEATAKLAGVYGKTDFLKTALQLKLLGARAAIGAVGQMAKMGNVLGIQQMLQSYPEFVVGQRAFESTQQNPIIDEAIALFPSCANAVQLAIREGQAHIVQLLLDAGAHEMSTADQWKNNTLQWAVSVAKPDIVKIALRPGVDLTHKNRSGKTALDIAVGRNFHEGIRLLREWEASNPSSA